VTVKFMGRTWPRLVEWVGEAVAEAAARVRPFRVSVDGLGVFPGPSRARVLWAGLRDPDGGLTALASALDEALAREFAPEKRRFTPHLTVARFDPPVTMGDDIEELRATRIEAPPVRVGSLVLYRSHLSPRGARYEALRRFRLRA
jgi:2'-5' RNA ligase